MPDTIDHLTRYWRCDCGNGVAEGDETLAQDGALRCRCGRPLSGDPQVKPLELAELFLRQRLIIKEHVADIRADPAWQRLPEQPVATIGGDLAIAFDIDAGGIGWVRSPDRDSKIRYRAGLAYTEEALPDPIRKALVDLDQHLECGGSPEDLPPRVVALLAPWKRQPLPA